MTTKQKRMRLAIPNDWDGLTWDCCLLFFPQSQQWKAIVRGLLRHLQRGWGWDETTGDLLATLDTAKLIHLTFDPSDEVRLIAGVNDVMACFDELIVQITRIADIMESTVQVDYTDDLDAIQVAVDILYPELGALIHLAETTNEVLGVASFEAGA